MPKSSGHYRLLSQHYTEEDKLLEPGTEVGTGTPHMWSGPPTVEMEPLDEAGKKAYETEVKRAGGTKIDPIESLPMTFDARVHEIPGQAPRGQQRVKPVPEDEV